MSTVIVTGGRNYDDIQKVFEVLDSEAPEKVIQGGAKGADDIAVQWCMERGVECQTYNADWDTYGRAAGPIRNRQMLEENKNAKVFAFPGGIGTANCVKIAKELGMTVKEIK